MVLCAVVAAIGVGLSAWMASSTWGTRLDAKIQNAFAAPANSGLWEFAFRTDDLLKTVVVLGGCLACLIALLSRGLRTAICVVLSIAIAGGLAELLKHGAVVVPPSGAFAPDGPSWPSVHTSTLAALGISLVLLPRGRLSRAVVLIGVAVGLVLACISLLVIRSHEPADLLGGCLLGLCVFAATAAVLDPPADRSSGRPSGLRRLVRL